MKLVPGETVVVIAKSIKDFDWVEIGDIGIYTGRHDDPAYIHRIELERIELGFKRNEFEVIGKL